MYKRCSEENGSDSVTIQKTAKWRGKCQSHKTIFLVKNSYKNQQQIHILCYKNSLVRMCVEREGLRYKTLKIK